MFDYYKINKHLDFLYSMKHFKTVFGIILPTLAFLIFYYEATEKPQTIKVKNKTHKQVIEKVYSTK
ncbi:hypothetical protein BWK60_09225 [Flavobacterium covae]|nr:hypothetical protein BWK60_09225 [Flavobacterium covae]